MIFDELDILEASLNDNLSRGVFHELLTTSGWVLYSSALYPGTGALLKRFLTAHARVPGVLSPEMLGVVPLHIFRFTEPPATIVSGALFSNGAVAKLTDGHAIVSMLWAAPATIDLWGYPKAVT